MPRLKVKTKNACQKAKQLCNRCIFTKFSLWNLKVLHKILTLSFYTLVLLDGLKIQVRQSKIVPGCADPIRPAGSQRIFAIFF